MFYDNYCVPPACNIIIDRILFFFFIGFRCVGAVKEKLCILSAQCLSSHYASKPLTHTYTGNSGICIVYRLNTFKNLIPGLLRFLCRFTATTWFLPLEHLWMCWMTVCPVLTHCSVCAWWLPAVPSESQVTVMKTLVESLPEENYTSLRYLITFLAQVQLIRSLPSRNFISVRLLLTVTWALCPCVRV